MSRAGAASASPGLAPVDDLGVKDAVFCECCGTVLFDLSGSIAIGESLASKAIAPASAAAFDVSTRESTVSRFHDGAALLPCGAFPGAESSLGGISIDGTPVFAVGFVLRYGCPEKKRHLLYWRFHAPSNVRSPARRWACRHAHPGIDLLRFGSYSSPYWHPPCLRTPRRDWPKVVQPGPAARRAHRRRRSVDQARLERLFSRRSQQAFGAVFMFETERHSPTLAAPAPTWSRPQLLPVVNLPSRRGLKSENRRSASPARSTALFEVHPQIVSGRSTGDLSSPAKVFEPHPSPAPAHLTIESKSPRSERLPLAWRKMSTRETLPSWL